MVDRISTLPDEVLCHILSFLSTEEAVATSVLSKRWKPLWISVPVLDYDEEIYLKDGKPSSYFEKFVYATILARDVHQSIRSFRLKYAGYYCDSPNVDTNAWLKAVIRRGVENLDIDTYYTDRRISLSCCIWRCTTLVALKLKGRLSLNVSSVELPSLKSLHLHSVEFRRNQNLIELLFRCPILEDLKAYDVYYVHEGSFWKEEFKCLPNLVRADLLHFHSDIPLKAICNVEFLSIKKYHQLVKVVPEFPNLMHVVLNFVIWDWVLEMLKNCPKLQVFEVVRCGRGFADKGFLPDPHNVPKCLTSRFRKCSLKYLYGAESELRFAKYIMQNSTTLRTMTICSESSLTPQAKHDILKELASCPRRSALCELSLE